MSYQKSIRPRRAVTLLHTSDLHVGSDTYPADALQGFKSVLEVAGRLNADALLIAGDLFDNGRVGSQLVRQVFRSLGELGRPVVVLPGNHDTVLTSKLPAVEHLASTVHVVKVAAGEAIVFDSLDLVVWGRPVYDHAPSFHPLEGMPPKPVDKWLVAIGHGIVVDGPWFRDRGSPIAPEELAAADCDYIALGHTHVFRDVTQGPSPAFYCGAPSGGQTLTAAHVTLDPARGVTVKCVEVPRQVAGTASAR